jgi:hypothetical protein
MPTRRAAVDAALRLTNEQIRDLKISIADKPIPRLTE